MPDFTTQLNETPMTNFHTSILALFDFMLNSPLVPAGNKAALAKARSQIDIALKGL